MIFDVLPDNEEAIERASGFVGAVRRRVAIDAKRAALLVPELPMLTPDPITAQVRKEAEAAAAMFDEAMNASR